MPLSLPDATGVEFRCATSPEELGPLLGYYRSAQSHVEADVDAIGHAAAAGESGQPWFMAMLRNGSPVAMLAGHVAETEFRWRIGYLRLWTTRSRVLTVANGGVVGEPDPGASSLLWRECLRRLPARGADVVKLTHLSTGSSFYRAVSTEPGWLARDPFIVPHIHYRLDLPESFEAYLAQRSDASKRDIKRTLSRFRKKYDGQFDVVCYRDAQQVDEAMQAVESVARLSYQRTLGVGFKPTPHTRAWWLAAAERGWLRVYVLRVRGVPCAYVAGHAYGGTFFGETTAFDPQYRDDRVGIYVWIQLIESLCASRDATRIDFGSGDAEYKRRLSSEVIDESDVYLFVPSLKGAYLRLMRLATVGLHNGGRKLLARFGLVDWVKTRWRRRMAPAADQGAAPAPD
ncbi:GNAT family N-acetyltransferase [Caldimonas sp. KR1-144]|uniref:GNAT family N-acetyltransferase n=1 Tax=Caldimonas sp. KR1-144 TaxID=3400911 RepID=UPI003C0CA349